MPRDTIVSRRLMFKGDLTNATTDQLINIIMLGNYKDPSRHMLETNPAYLEICRRAGATMSNERPNQPPSIKEP